MRSNKQKLIQIHPNDTVAVALQAMEAGESAQVNGRTVTVTEEIPTGHKVALQSIQEGDCIIKYGASIGLARQAIAEGEWVHEHNLRSALTKHQEYSYRASSTRDATKKGLYFDGFLRDDGTVGTRNEIWILPLVGCINNIVQELAQKAQKLICGGLEGIYAFPHPYGCSQLGEDLDATRRILAALSRHGNAGGVLVVGLGCENNTMEQFQAELGTWDPRRVKFLLCQQEEDELAAGQVLLSQLAEYVSSCHREAIPISKLTVGLKCGGSDGLSGVTANPLLGRFCDTLTAYGGTAILSEVPEMFGAEQLLLSRCADETVFTKAADMINNFKAYFVAHGQGVGDNPSPGNHDGGITTLEEKSLGNVQKGGVSIVTDVLDYGQQVKHHGLTLLYGPGNDQVSCTALTAAGAQIILFTTGRGTPFGAPVPTVKIASNTALYEKKQRWIDMDAASLTLGGDTDAVDRALLDLVLKTASGKQTKAEEMGAREIVIFKTGVTL